MASFTFGSFGDVLALTSLTIACARSLSDSTGSASDLQDFIDELQSLKDVLDKVAPHLTTPKSNASPLSSASTATYSPKELEQCHKAMEVFHHNVKKYEKRLNGNGLRSWFYKMLWAIWKKDQITDFRVKLARHRQAITMLQLALQSEQLSRIAAVAEMPNSMKSTIANSIEFSDAVGTSIFFPMDWCSSWQTLDALLKARFGGSPFGRFVQRGQYHLSCDNGKTIIRPQDWRRVVEAGMVVEMSIILKKSTSPDRSKTCPICRYLNSDVSPQKGGWIDCLGIDCNARFQISQMDKDDSDSDITFPKLQNFEESEVKHLRRVEIMETAFGLSTED
ncbi:hypothetical protein BD410DRAFT_902802 [Rickenella mellea]|uniref:Ubiquitin-like domain-containing protein n=1 Tax=Rickenella mellea TaxID=50990 RepID=A0A4Y7PIX1_9AGAM|nr:hypothetical protein BD410DRAFT_902802 [Rickenella mellea]